MYVLCLYFTDQTVPLKAEVIRSRGCIEALVLEHPT